MIFDNVYRGKLLICRGVPGSGKSYTAKRLTPHVFSADAYFEAMPGGYAANWSFEKLDASHRYCEYKVREAMQEGITPIAVDNTNLHNSETRVYVNMAAQYQYEPEIVESDSPWWQAIIADLGNKYKRNMAIKEWAAKLAHGFEWNGQIIKNVHEVPEKTIAKMLNTYHPYTIEDVLSTDK